MICFLNNPKFEQNQPKTNEKPTFERLDDVKSDISKDFELPDILGYWQGISDFSVSELSPDFIEIYFMGANL